MLQPQKTESKTSAGAFARQQKKSLELRLQPVNERKKLIRKFSEFLLANRGRIGQAVHKDFKKPLMEIDLSELYPVLSEIRHTLANLNEWAKPRKVDAPLAYFGTRSEVRFEPKGVCLIIAPWNYPFSLCFGPLISCLAAGNTAIIKPSEMTPNTATLIRELTAVSDSVTQFVRGDTNRDVKCRAALFDKNILV